MANYSDSLPLYIRIANGAKEYLLLGVFKEEVQIPSTTTLAKQYGINIATVNKAISVLVDEGLVYKKRGVGMFVKKGAVKKLIKERRKTFVANYVNDTVMEAKKLRYSFEELRVIATKAFYDIYGEEAKKIGKN